MNPDEKLMDLKRAYADIILNTAKEAAARIMASERKSVRLQHELNVSKEQAVQMLLRLKQMSDSKIREAETNSLSKQKKIEELEAQLQEAEDIVNDLRNELRAAHDELERVRKSHLNEKKPEADDIVKELRDELKSAHDEIDRMRKSHSKEKKLEITSSATVFMEKSALDQINEAYNTYQEDENDGIQEDDNRLNDVALEDSFSRLGNSYISKPKLPSIILGSKGTEPYRNKRTQRIRAFEEKLMAGGLAFSDEVKNKENGNNEEIKKKPGNRKKGDVAPVEKVKPLKRKRNTKNKKNTIPSNGKNRVFFEGDITSDTSHREIDSDNIDTELDENPLDLLSRLSENILLKCTETSESEALSKKVGLESACYGVEKADVAVECSQEVAASTECELSKQPATFKFTFQRRKKQGLSTSGANEALETKVVEDMEMAKQDDDVPASVAESSRDSRRMAQVARQLISLSEQKWWK